MKYLLDTNVVVDHLRRKVEIDEDVVFEGAGISIVTYSELSYGAYKSAKPKRNLKELAEAIVDLQLDIVSLDTDAGDLFGRLKSELEVKGERLDNFDLLIAATAMVHDLVLVTRNKRHFGRVKGLEVYGR